MTAEKNLMCKPLGLVVVSRLGINPLAST